jgi:hypothetical protein
MVLSQAGTNLLTTRSGPSDRVLRLRALRGVFYIFIVSVSITYQEVGYFLC